VPDKVLLLSAKFPTLGTDSSSNCTNVSSEFAGHRAVVPGTLAAFREFPVPVLYNPTCHWEHADIVVITDGDPLECPWWADVLLTWKKTNKIGLVYYGPNAFQSEVCAKAKQVADYMVAPSSFPASTMRKREPSLQWREWPVGVDTSHWKPNPGISNQTRDTTAILYLKSPVNSTTQADVIRILKNHNFSTIHEIKYGAYTPEVYLNHLQQSSIMVVFSDNESQGIFLFEAWSAGVPTYHYAGNGFHMTWSDIEWLLHPAPYLTSETGLMFVDVQDFNKLLGLREKFAFQPRDWILREGSTSAVSQKIWADILADYQKYVHGVNL
jgi:hypothetical protein